MDRKSSNGRALVLHPLLFAAWPVLQLWAGNLDEVHAADALLAGLALVAAAAGAYLLLRRLVPDRARAGLLVGLGVVLLFSYSAIHDRLSGWTAALGWDFLASESVALRHRYVFALLGVAAGALSLWILRTRRDLNAVTRLANTVACVLVGFSVVQIGLGRLQLARAGVEASESIACGSEHAGRPDIYFIVLDRYGSADTLADAYGFDNRAFYAALERRGFVVRDLRANYAKTTLSVSSCLEMEYHASGSRLGNVIRRVRGGHAVGRFLKERSYRYYHLGGWIDPTASCRIADEVLSLPGSSRAKELWMALVQMTPARVLPALSRFETRLQRDTVRFQLESLAGIPREPGPRFVFVHMLVPHPPFVFDRHGNPVGNPPPYGPGSKRHFIEQLRFTNDRVIEVIDQILARSERPPVIVLQGDEGPFLREDDAEKDLVAQRRIRTGILGAILLPGRGPEALNGLRTPVNTFRVLFNELFGTKLELLEDRIWSWHGFRRPLEPAQKGLYEFEDITSDVLD